jgi:hydrogenase expression/formation protein HypC
MCWAVPTKLVEIDGQVGKVEIGGTVREVGLQLLEAPRVGDYVLIHAGFAIEKVDEEEAAKTLELLAEIGYGDSLPSRADTGSAPSTPR